MEHLDVSGNLISDAEAGAIRQLSSLKQLLLGEHNYASDSLLEDVGQLQNLTVRCWCGAEEYAKQTLRYST